MKIEFAAPTIDVLKGIVDEHGQIDDKSVGLGYGTFEVKTAHDTDEWLIQGYASTLDVDDENDIVLPTAFTETLPRFMEFPNLHVNHKVREMPVGSVIEATIDKRGLYVVASISKAEAELWVKINEKIMKAFSFMFFIKSGGTMFDEETEIRTITNLELIEVSVVGRPANRAARLEVLKSCLQDLASEGIVKMSTTKAGANEMTEEEIRKLASDAAKDIRALAVSESKDAATTAATSAVEVAMVKHAQTVGDIQKSITEIQEFCKTHDGSEVKEKLEVFEAKILEVEKAGAAIRNAKQLPWEGGSYLEDYDTPESATEWEKSAQSELKMTLPMTRLMLNEPKFVAKGEGLQELIAEWQSAAFDVYTIHSIMRKSAEYSGDPRSLICWKKYWKLSELIAKSGTALDTTEHSDWVPTGFTGEILRRVELESKVAALFQSFTMTQKVFDWPILGSTRPTLYLMGESTDETGTKIKDSIMSDGKSVFTAVKLGVRVLTSVEMVEDALTAILPIIQEDMISTIVRGVEDAIMNGDTAGTHQDTDTTAATDRRKAWDGLRKAGLANTPDDASDAILTATMLRATRKLIAVRGVHPSTLAYIVGVKSYVNLLSDTNIQTVDKFGTAATWLTGFITAVDGIPVVVSEFQREDLNAAGVDDGVTATRGAACCVHRPSWKMGDRRMVTLKTDEIISTDQVDVVATVRKDFAEVLGSPSVGQVDNLKTP